jgi:hypothetical protein
MQKRFLVVVERSEPRKLNGRHTIDQLRLDEIRCVFASRASRAQPAEEI